MRNQFRSLDEDEVEFLDSVLESTRAKEAEVKKETSQQLDAFRGLQREAEKSAVPQDAEPVAEGAETWVTGPRKRKKGRESVIGGVKLRRVSTTEKQAVSPAADQSSQGDKRVSLSATGPTKKEEVPAEGAASASFDKQDATRSTASPKEAVKKQSPPETEKEGKPSKSSSPPAVGLGLAAYSSDEDEGD